MPQMVLCWINRSWKYPFFIGFDL